VLSCSVVLHSKTSQQEQTGGCKVYLTFKAFGWSLPHAPPPPVARKPRPQSHIASSVQWIPTSSAGGYPLPPVLIPTPFPSPPKPTPEQQHHPLYRCRCPLCPHFWCCPLQMRITSKENENTPRTRNRAAIAHRRPALYPARTPAHSQARGQGGER